MCLHQMATPSLMAGRACEGPPEGVLIDAE